MEGADEVSGDAEKAQKAKEPFEEIDKAGGRPRAGLGQALLAGHGCRGCASRLPPA